MKRSWILIPIGIGFVAFLSLIGYPNNRWSEAPKVHSNSPVQTTAPIPPGRVAQFRDVTGQSNIEDLRTAIMDGDKDQIVLALDRLAQHTEEYPETFNGLLAALKLETDPEVLSALCQLVSEHWTIHREKVIIAAALEMSQSSEPAKRRMAIELLGQASEINSTLIESFNKFQNDTDADIRRAGAATLKQWHSKFPESFQKNKVR